MTRLDMTCMMILPAIWPCSNVLYVNRNTVQFTSCQQVIDFTICEYEQRDLQLNILELASSETAAKCTQMEQIVPNMIGLMVFSSCSASYVSCATVRNTASVD